jgi:hypothetical protein
VTNVTTGVSFFHYVTRLPEIISALLEIANKPIQL